MSTFADEYLKRRKAAAGNGNTGTPVQNTVPTGTESMDEAEFAAAYLAKRQKTLQPERYEAKQRRKTLEQLDQVEKEYDQKWYAWNNAVNNGGIVGASQSQNERAIAEFENIQQTRNDLLAKVTEKDRYEWAGVKLTENALKDKDFAAYAKKGAAVENPKMTDVMTSSGLFGSSKKPVNKVMYTLQNWDAYEKLKFSNNNPVLGTVDAGAYGLYDLAPHMTADEVNIYNYYLAKDMEDGTSKADEYLRFMEETLNARKGAAQAGELKGKTALELGYGAIAGLDQFVQGVKNVGSMFSWDSQSNYVPTSSAQVAGSIIREDLKDDSIKYYNPQTGKWENHTIAGNSLGQMAYDTIQTSSNMAPSILLSTAVGIVNPAAGAAVGGVLLGASAAGNAYQQKIQAGYIQSQARSYGALVGISEAVLETALGAVGGAAGKGLKGALGKVSQTGIQKIDDVLARVAKTAGGKIATNALGEGAEEAIQSILEPAFAHVVAGEEFTVDMEETLYSALLGAVMGAGFGSASPNTYQGNIQKITANEKTVLKAETDARVKAQQEKLGRELTAKEKSDIEKKVRSELEKGYVTTDRIEEILGGESWKKYQEAYDREQGVLKDLEGLYEGEELERQRQAIRDNSVLAGMREELSRSVSESVKGDRFLHESYLEKGRRTEKFTADVSKYKGKQAEIVQKAMDSGVLNNTNRSHELVDLIAKIGADKDIDFDFVNNEKLKESGFALDGVTVNGYVNENGIAINVNSQKALNSVVGHEITHVLEGTELYGELTEWVKKYANIKEKDGYNNRLKQLISLYQNVEGYKGAEGMAKIHQEAVADLVGDFLFTDPKFLQRLLENRNLFQRLWDEIKYLATVTSGTEEARRLAELQRAFEKAYNGETKKPTQEGGVRYSVGMQTAQKEMTAEYHKVVDQVIKGTYGRTESAIIGYTPGIYQKLGMPSLPMVIGPGHIYSIAKSEKEAKAENRYSKKVNYHGLGEQTVKDILAKVSDPVMILSSKDVDRNAVPLRSTHSVVAIVDIGANGNSVLIPIEITAERTVNGSQYDVNVISTAYGKNTKNLIAEAIAQENIGEVGVYYLDKKASALLADGVQFPKRLIDALASNGIVHSFSEKVNMNVENVMQSRQFKRWFGDWQNHPENASKIVNADGAPKVVYHGTNAKFNVFQSKSGEYWFSENEDYAEAMMEERGGGEVKAVYLNMRNPYYAKLPPGQFSDPGYEAQILRAAKAAKCDGVIIENDTTDPLAVETFYVVFKPEQIKSATDNIGTFDGSNPDIRYSMSENTKTEKAEGWQIKGEDVLLQQEADANGLVWENGVPFRKDLLELARKRQSGEFSIAPPVPESAKTETAKSQAAANIAPPVPGAETASTVAAETESKVNPKEDAREGSAPFEVEEATQTPTTVRERTGAKLANLRTELAENQRHRQELSQKFDEEIAKLQERYNGLKNKDTKEAQKLLRQIERQKRLKKDRDAEYAKRISDIEGRVEKLQDLLRQDLTRVEIVEQRLQKVDKQLEEDRQALEESFGRRREALEAKLQDKDSFVKEQAMELYRELNGLKKGVKASEDLGYLLDHGYTWDAVKSALLSIKDSPGKNLTPGFQLANIAREMLDQNYENSIAELANLDAEYLKKLEQLEKDAAQKRTAIRTADQRSAKQQEYTDQMEQLVGDTSTWKDKKLGISYRVNTLRRNLRDVVRDAKGNRDIAKADAIYDELQGKYNQHEAQLKRESTEIKSKYAELKITKAEDKYIQMLGELLYNPDTELSEATVQEYLEKHKKQIDEKKVDKVIEMARADYDSLLQRVNEVLREQGMKTIPYRKGYFPHFTEDKQGILGKIFNWKTKDNEIPTDIAGLTEQFSPNRSWQSFNKERTSDTTTYSFLQGMDSYVQGSLDWIHHIEDIQKRRALENYIRYIHSEKGIQERIDAVKSSEELDADEVQEQIDSILKEAWNPLGNFVQDLRTGTNTLAGKKSSLDRGVEGATNRKIYSVMTNLSSRVSANMVAGSISSALTNFIPITQSWGQVSPLSTLVAMGDTIKATIRDDGIVNKSDFLTNRLRNPDKLYQGFWDKASGKVGFLMEAVDSFTSQTVWRSKYRENLASGMSESEAIKNADQFAENVLAGRSRGNMPTLFDAKNPIAKMFTAFQLEVNNQYGYMLKDMPQDVKNKSVGRLVAGYAGIFLGAYAYNALYSMLTGRDAAFDPIGIVEDLIRDLNDDDDEPVEDIKGFAENVLQEVPFLGGLMGGGRVPISSALPYDGDIMKTIEGIGNMATGDFSDFTSEWLNPAYYLLAPMGGGQLKKTIGGAAMYLNDKEIKGSYTDSGNLRFPVEDDFWSVVQAISMGQWSGENAREYFDEGRKPLTQNQMQEFMDSGMSIHDYWEYRDGLADLSKQSEKIDYINGMDIDEQTKRVLKSYLFDEKGYAEENPEKYAFLQEEIGYIEWKELDDDTKEAWTWAYKHQDQYRYMKENGVMPGDYTVWMMQGLDFKDEQDKAYEWGYENQEKAIVGDLFGGGVKEYRGYVTELNQIKSDKDEDGNTIAGSTKQKRLAYIAELDLEDGQKYILFKSLYPKDTSFDGEIIDYLLEQKEISYNEKRKILTELGIDLS